MGEVRTIAGKLIDQPTKVGDPDVTALLVELAQKAAAGEVTAFAVVYRDHEDRLWTKERGEWFGGRAMAIGALACLQHDMMAVSDG